MSRPPGYDELEREPELFDVVERFAGVLRVDDEFFVLVEADPVDFLAAAPDEDADSVLFMTVVTTFLAPSATNSATSGAFSRT